jgi:hypothetical protein
VKIALEEVEESHPVAFVGLFVVCGAIVEGKTMVVAPVAL